jgi:hypothetical protein
MGHHQLFYGQGIKMEKIPETLIFFELTKPNGAKIIINKNHISFIEPRHDGSTYMKLLSEGIAIKEKYNDIRGFILNCVG